MKVMCWKIKNYDLMFLQILKCIPEKGKFDNLNVIFNFYLIQKIVVVVVVPTETKLKIIFIYCLGYLMILTS